MAIRHLTAPLLKGLSDSTTRKAISHEEYVETDVATISQIV